jgi:hypothetical protein
LRYQSSCFFLFLEFGFVGTWFIVAKPVLDELAWTMVLLGNLLAAIGMAIYLRLRTPASASLLMGADTVQSVSR